MDLWFGALLALVAVGFLWWLTLLRATRPYLWTYWENRDGRTSPPAHIQLCLASIQHRCQSTYRVVVLDEQTVTSYLPNLRSNLAELPVAQKVDYLRVALLHRYGGVWVDADTIMLSDLAEVVQKLRSHDYVGYGCTATICHHGKPRPSNWVMASRPGGKLITRVLANLDRRLTQGQVNFIYHELGKEILWAEIHALELEGYDYYHYSSDYDGTRDAEGRWIHSPQHLSTKLITFNSPERLQFSFLANAELMGWPEYSWILQKSQAQLLEGPWNLSRLFRRAFQIPEKYSPES
jgi:Capsular polysaccharide synthesis protein